MLRQGLRTIVSSHARLEVVGEAGDGLEGLEMARTLRPDVVVMDVNMPRCGGIAATERIKEEFSDMKVVALSMHHSPDMVERMKRAGASHYITKESAASQLCRAIVEAAADGES
jgi:DNA-binding NarL/FixJ family response regulator